MHGPKVAVSVVGKQSFTTKRNQKCNKLSIFKSYWKIHNDSADSFFNWILDKLYHLDYWNLIQSKSNVYKASCKNESTKAKTHINN